MCDFDTVINRRDTSCLKWDFRFRHTDNVSGTIPSGLADYDFQVPAAVQKALHERIDHGVMGYTGVSEDYFTAVTDWYQKHHNTTVEREWFHTIPGVIPAIVLMMQTMTKPGDKVLIQNPVYHAFERAITGIGREAIDSPLVKTEDGAYAMDFDALDKALAGDLKAMILCNPHNPIGRVWQEAELLKVAELCQKHNVFLIVDEIWADLTFFGHKYHSALRLPKQYHDNMAVCLAPTKTFGFASMRIANMMVPNLELGEKLEARMLAFGFDVYDALSITAIMAAYKDGEQWLNELRSYIEGNMLLAQQMLAEQLPQVRFKLPESSYLAWLDFSAFGIDDDALKHKIIEEAKVIPSMGASFGEMGKGFVRLNLGCP
ncbi:MalY/PatB family protein, partial [Photobacterium sanctipauli]